MALTGSIAAIYITDRASAPMTKVRQIKAMAGQGIEGDRYFLGAGTYSKKPEPGRQITLIKSEVLRWLNDEFKINVNPEESRRNVLTRDIEINELVVTDFFAGPVLLRAHRITQPCRYLEKLIDRPGLYKALWDNGGISCEILSDGIIRQGDSIITKTNDIS